MEGSRGELTNWITKGDPVTFVGKDGKAHRNHVYRVDGAFTFWVNLAKRGGNIIPLRFDEEGTTWIRGHHDSEAENAMLAAYALTQD